MDERLRELIAALADEAARADGLAELTDEQIVASADELRSLFRAIRAGEVEDVDASDVATLESIHAAVQVLDGETAVRAEAAAERAAQIAALEASIDGPEDADEADEAADEAAEPTEDAEPETAEAAIEPEPEPAPTARAAARAERAARRPSMAALAAQVPAQGRPSVESQARTQPRWQTIDGRPFNTVEELTERFVAAIDSVANMAMPPGVGQKVPVVRFKTEMSDNHHIGSTDGEELVTRKLNAITAAASRPGAWTPEQRALVASGGWCGPSEPRFDIPDIVTADRPFRDALPRVTSTRGNIDYVRAARLATITANAAGAAVTTWENTTDITPGESTKTRQTMACRTVQTEALGAVVARVRFGNFQARAFPEDVEHDLMLVQARHARVAETRLLDALIADMAIDVAQTGVLGTARDIKHHFAQAAAEMKYTERSDRLVRAALSDVALPMIVGDVVFQQASGEVDALMVDEAWARGFLASIPGVGTVLVRDVPTGADAFVTNADGENLADFPDDFEIPFWFDGSAVFADGGRLDLGIIRDSTLNDTNDYEMFMETFEGLLYLGPYGKTLTLTNCPNGESQVATDETGSLCSGS
jgi:hypothetical protein